jgi:hypothetical protein
MAKQARVKKRYLPDGGRRLYTSPVRAHQNIWPRCRRFRARPAKVSAIRFISKRFAELIEGTVRAVCKAGSDRTSVLLHDSRDKSDGQPARRAAGQWNRWRMRTRNSSARGGARTAEGTRRAYIAKRRIENPYGEFETNSRLQIVRSAHILLGVDRRLSACS